MSKEGLILEKILKKATFFSKEIDRFQEQKKILKKEKADHEKKENQLEHDIFSTAETMHSFLQETISSMTELCEKIQDKENSKLVEAKNIESNLKKEEMKQHIYPLHAEVVVSKKKNKKKKEKISQKLNNSKEKVQGEYEMEEEVYLFDL